MASNREIKQRKRKGVAVKKLISKSHTYTEKT